MLSSELQGDRKLNRCQPVWAFSGVIDREDVPDVEEILSTQSKEAACTILAGLFWRPWQRLRKNSTGGTDAVSMGRKSDAQERSRSISWLRPT